MEEARRREEASINGIFNAGMVSQPVSPSKCSSRISVTDGSWHLGEGSGIEGSLISQQLTLKLTSVIEDRAAQDSEAGDVPTVPDSADICQGSSGSNPAIRRQQSLLNRTLRHATVSGIRHSMLTLVATALGAVALSVSYIFQLCGIGMGLVALISGAVLAYISTVALMEMCTQTGCQTYAALFSHVAGPVAGPCLDFMIFIYGNGVLVLCLVFLGDFIPALVGLADSLPSWAKERTTAIIFCAVIVFPLGLPKEITALTRFTSLQIFGIAYTAVLVSVKAPGEYSIATAANAKPGFGTLRFLPANLLNLLEAFPLCIYAYNCHNNVVPIAGRLVRPTKARINKLSFGVFVMQLFFYVVIGICGYLSFLDTTPQEILKSYDLKDPFVIIARALLTPSLIVVIGMNLQPAMRSGLRVLDYLRGQTGNSESSWAPMSPGPSPLASPNASPQSSPPGSPRTSPLGPRPSPPPQRRQSQKWAEHGPQVVFLTAFCLVLQAGIAVVVPNAADIIGIIGATAGTAMMMTIPAYAIGVVLPRSPKNIAKQVILYVFSVVALLSVPIKVLRLTGHLPKA